VALQDRFQEQLLLHHCHWLAALMSRSLQLSLLQQLRHRLS
jgi:hypothetical protein